MTDQKNSENTPRANETVPQAKPEARPPAAWRSRSLKENIRHLRARYTTLFVRERVSKSDLEFMDEFEAASYRQGSVFAIRLCLGITVLFFVLLVLSCVVHREEITRGEGSIIMSRGVQPIQSLNGGIITDIFVRENQEVEKGTVVARVANIKAIAERQTLQNQEVEFTLALKRLEAELNNTDLAYTPEEQGKYPNVVRDQMRIYTSRHNQNMSELRELEAQLEQRKREVEESQLRRKQYEQSLLLMQQQEENIRPAVGKAISEMDYLQLRQRIVSTQGELNGLAQSISRSQSAVREAEEKLKNREPERKSKVSDEMNKVRQQLDAAREALTGREQLVKDADLVVPMRSVVKRIIMKQDMVAKPAETIMEVLPLDDTLEVTARFKPGDRGFIMLGQNATIKVSAYDFSVYGGLPAVVTDISADTIEDNKGKPWYEVRLTVNDRTLGPDDLELKVGMTVTVDVHSGSKSIFNYLMKPLLKSQLTSNVITHEVKNEDDTSYETRGAQTNSTSNTP